MIDQSLKIVPPFLTVGRHFEISGKIHIFGNNIDGQPGVGLVVKVAGLGPKGPEFKHCFAVELTPGGVDSAWGHNHLG